MRTRVRRIDKDKWIVEVYRGHLWHLAQSLPFDTESEAMNFALYHSKSHEVLAEFQDGELIK